MNPMSDQVLIANSVIALIGTIFSGVMVYLMARLKTKTEKAAVEVKAVATKLDKKSTVAEEKLNAIAKVADATHKLTNSNMGVQLRISAVQARRISDLTRDKADALAAIEAETLLLEHQTNQDRVDEKYPGGVPDSQDPQMS